MTDPTVVQPDEAKPAPPAPPAPAAPRSRSEIAAELFGPQFHGKAEEAKPEEVKEQPKPDDTEKGGEVAVEEPAEGEETPQEGKEPAPEDTGETPIATISEMAEHLGTSVEYLNSLKVPVHVDGTSTEATIGDLIKSYQLTEAAEHRLSDAKMVAQKESEAWAVKQQQLEGQFRVAAELVKSAEATLDRDVKAIDPNLRDQDPAEWAARVAEFQARRGFIEKMKADTVAGYQASTQAQAVEYEARKQQYLAEQSGVLLEKLPEWQDQKRAAAEKAKLADYLFRSGFVPQELSNLIDHRHVLLARKAMLYDESRGQVDTAKKRVATVPKIMKPGAPKAKEQLATERLQALKAKMESSGKEEDAYAYRMAKRGVSK